MIRKWFNKSRYKLQRETDEESLLIEVEQAKKDWIRAYDQLDLVLGKEQVDYAIYSLEAAEKRYEMLLRQIKLQQDSYMGNGEVG